MNKILILTIVSLLPILIVITLTLSLSQSEIGLVDMDELSKMARERYDYVEQNTNHIFTEREYSAVMRLADGDPKRAVEIFNDPDYPENFYDDTGTLP